MPSRLMGHLFPLSGYYGIERVIWGSLVPIVGTTNFAQKKTGIDLRGVRHGLGHLLISENMRDISTQITPKIYLLLVYIKKFRHKLPKSSQKIFAAPSAP